MTANLQSKDYIGEAILYMAMESKRHRMEARFQQWGKDRITTIVADNWKALFEQISLAKGQLRLPFDYYNGM
uniref:Uncharacterized protein n=1 Tax=Candidatus Kentrum sp. TC TaxID=2126339 RepID=A0A450YS49_9GAMM|nr:MAG: hypothetical protein BECKTC1821E_GA0114239_10281 [Candidatus Kentron sp. TC]VFK44368.1 MAG: hypothetical protein BECKTC1821D_GA0114238_102043 [Candidatus Kentron sp. TC]